MITGNNALVIGIGYLSIGLLTAVAFFYRHPKPAWVKVPLWAGLIFIFVLGALSGMMVHSFSNNHAFPWSEELSVASDKPINAQQLFIINRLIEQKANEIVAELEKKRTITAHTIQLVNQKNAGYANLSLDANGNPYFELRNKNNRVQGILTFKKLVIHRTGDIVIRPESPLFSSHPNDFNISETSATEHCSKQLSY